VVVILTNYILSQALCPTSNSEATESAFCDCSTANSANAFCLMELIAAIPAALLSLLPASFMLLFPAGLEVRDYFTQVRPYQKQSQGEMLYEKAQAGQRADMKTQLGFMHIVKEEVEHLYELLETKHFWDKDARCWRKYRLSVFIDDLDRCPNSVTMQVLESVILLLVDGPITCYLAIDPRVVVAAIEEHNSVLSTAGISGHEFLDKIVQIPFCLPELSCSKKQTFLSKLIEGPELVPDKIYRRLANAKKLNNCFMEWAPVNENDSDGKFVSLLARLAEQLLQTQWLKPDPLRAMEMGMGEKQLIKKAAAGNLSPVEEENFLNMMSQQDTCTAHRALPPLPMQRNQAHQQRQKPYCQNKAHAVQYRQRRLKDRRRTSSRWHGPCRPCRPR